MRRETKGGLARLDEPEPHHVANNVRIGAWRQCFTPSRLTMQRQELSPLLTDFYGVV
jgi:hypothetical protein